MMMGTGCVGCIYIGMHIHAKLCNAMQSRHSSSAHLGLCDYVVDEEGGFPAPVDWTGGVFCWE